MGTQGQVSDLGCQVWWGSSANSGNIPAKDVTNAFLIVQIFVQSKWLVSARVRLRIRAVL